jgi:parallel beta-helix repeat protein
MLKRLSFGVAAAALLSACGQGADKPADEVKAAAPTVLDAVALQTMLIEAEEGAVIALPEGTIELVDGLSLDVAGVTIKGAGQDKTILDFSGQTGAGEGLLVTSDDVTMEGFTIRDTKGDGIKSKGADRIIYRDLTVEWSGEPDEDNGAYGVYPVESSDVLVERVTVRGASDAGIYVGQSDNIIVRDSLAEYNVAGIEIENSTRADVYDNIVTKNAGGLLVFDLPDLPKVGGHSTRLFNNQVFDNNTRNFAPPGNIVASVPSGTGVIVQANDKVEIFENTFKDNRTAHVILVAYSPEFDDDRFNPLVRNTIVTGNSYENGGYEPQGDLQLLAMAMGGSLPDIVADGVDRWGDKDAVDLNMVIDEDESVGFVNLGLGSYPLNPSNLSPSDTRPTGSIEARLPAVKLSHSE